MVNAESRRSFLKLSGAVGAAVMTAPIAAADARPRDVDRKFYADGRVHPFAGNTVVCHLDQQGENSGPFNALLDIYRDIPGHRFARKITLLPPSSYHMTIFGGANDPDRKLGLWPKDIALDTPIDECSRILGDKLRAANVSGITPIRMRVKLEEPSADENPLTIRLLPLDEGENRKLRALRDTLSTLFGIRAPNHEGYSFHITMAYLIQNLTAMERREFRLQLAKWHSEVARRCPVITLGKPEYCTLTDMFAFHRQFYVG
jgi:hypothetical protein